MIGAGEIARTLAQCADRLVADLLPGGRREGLEWRCGSIAGEAGHSLGVHLAAAKAGVWCDFATGQAGNALDLVRVVLRLDMAEAIAWSRRWLGLEDGEAPIPRRPEPTFAPDPAPDPKRWCRPWWAAQPIGGTSGERYLTARGLAYCDPRGDVLRFAERHPRRGPTGQPEHHPALLALLRDVRTGASCGTINIYLLPDGSDRLRDSKGKTTWGRAAGAAVMLAPYDDVTMGLTVCEGAETGIALPMAGLAPVWAMGGAGNLGALPVLGGIEALTIAADPDDAGQRSADACAARWRATGREVVIIAPPAGDWADPRRAA